MKVKTEFIKDQNLPFVVSKNAVQPGYLPGSSGTENHSIANAKMHANWIPLVTFSCNFPGNGTIDLLIFTTRCHPCATQPSIFTRAVMQRGKEDQGTAGPMEGCGGLGWGQGPRMRRS